MKGTKSKDPYVEELHRKLKQAEKDNEELSNSIEELNSCYTQKIQVLEETIEGYESRIEELLNWKKDYIDQQLFDNHKYEEENKKLLGIIDQLYDTFELQKNKLRDQIREKQATIEELREEKEDLYGKTVENDQKVEELVREHMRIEQLKTELIELKAEIGQTQSEYYQEKISKINEENQSLASLAKDQAQEAPVSEEEEEKSEIKEDNSQENDQFEGSKDGYSALKEIKGNNSMEDEDGRSQTRVKIAYCPTSNTNELAENIL